MTQFNGIPENIKLFGISAAVPAANIGLITLNMV
jgi:hypothetical protein